MDNGSILFVLLGGPFVIIAVVGGAIALLFAVALAINLLTGAAVRGAIELIRSRRDKSTPQETEPVAGDHQ
ncbi:hypothetical protein [Microbacterium sp. TWP3-1-2b2]|uniref:hypothetical protein n=1 Tax=Microbacterium sp. TWP3-1-2b2 TaxID=2804651 RepID=UPI003CED6A38